MKQTNTFLNYTINYTIIFIILYLNTGSNNNPNNRDGQGRARKLNVSIKHQFLLILRLRIC